MGFIIVYLVSDFGASETGQTIVWLYYCGRDRFRGQVTFVLHIQWRIVIKDSKIATVGRKSLVFGSCVDTCRVCEERGQDNWRIMLNELNELRIRIDSFGGPPKTKREGRNGLP
ncbi:hypothetical protein TNCV_4889941 [Trichonephila clavipes]|nr:hypothetical protein TNCV_4889941 [Trichonephila clavipes]